MPRTSSVTLTHPIAEALRDAFPCGGDDCSVLEATEVAGKGIVATVNGRRVAVGNAALMGELGAAWHGCGGDIAFAIAVKVAVLLLAGVGLAPMWLAVFGDVGVMVLCALNATRALR